VIDKQQRGCRGRVRREADAPGPRRWRLVAHSAWLSQRLSSGRSTRPAAPARTIGLPRKDAPPAWPRSWTHRAGEEPLAWPARGAVARRSRRFPCSETVADARSHPAFPGRDPRVSCQMSSAAVFGRVRTYGRWRPQHW